MRKYTQRELKDFAKLGLAINITNWSDKECYKLREKQSITQVGYSAGIYGLNGMLLQDENGQYYVITARNGNMFIF